MSARLVTSAATERRRVARLARRAARVRRRTAADWAAGVAAIECPIARAHAAEVVFWNRATRSNGLRDALDPLREYTDDMPDVETGALADALVTAGFGKNKARRLAQGNERIPE